MKMNAGDKFATYIFRIFVGFIGLGLLYLFLSPKNEPSSPMLLLSIIFILALFIGYALFGNNFMSSFLARYKNKQKVESNTSIEKEANA